MRDAYGSAWSPHGHRPSRCPVPLGAPAAGRPRRAAAAAIVGGAMGYTIRPARTPDVPVIRKLIDSNVESGRLLTKATVTLYEDVQEFCVAELAAGKVSASPVPD